MTRRRHLIIPDRQAKHGVPLDHNRWIGYAIRDYRPDVVVDLGDNADFESVSTHSQPGSLEREGKRLIQDIAAANKAEAMLREACEGYTPKRRIRLRGNHEQRLVRYINSQPVLEGIIGLHLLDDDGWEIVPYANGSPGVVTVDGIAYAHYFANPNTGKPIGGTASYKLAQIGQPNVQGHVQGYDIGSRQFATGRVIRGIVAGSCLTPDHKVLTADLRYVPLGDVKAGDKLVSFDEEPAERRKRRYVTGTVEAVKRSIKPCFAVTLESGKVFKVTGDHRWLTRINGPAASKVASTYLWRTTAQLRKGTVIPRPLDEWEELDTRDAGYLRGMYDGEGCLYARPTNSVGGAVMQLGLSQKPGAVLDETIRILGWVVGVDALTTTNQKGVSDLRIKGGARECAKMLGSIRPIRLLAKFTPELLGSMTTSQNDKVASIEPIGDQEIVEIAIDAKTMIVEGYPHHNCYMHDEPYKGQANTHWRGIIVLNEVRNGDFCEMPLTLDYLCRRYEGMSLRRYLQRNYRNAKQRFSLARGEG